MVTKIHDRIHRIAYSGCVEDWPVRMDNSESPAHGGEYYGWERKGSEPVDSRQAFYVLQAK